MKKTIFTHLQICLLILAFGFWQNNLHAQTAFTINWTGLTGGSTNATGVPTGINIIQQYNGVVSNCSTASNGGTATYNAIIQAAPGYTVTITSIGGAAYASNAGSRNYVFQLTNAGTYTQGTQPNINGTGSCGSPTTLATYTVPAAGQTLNAGSQATISVLKTPGSTAGTGYGLTSRLTITGVVTPICNAPTNLAENNVTATSSDFNWDAGGANTYEYVLDQTSATPSGAGTALTTNSFSTSSLSPSTTYYFHLRRKCGTGNFSNWIYVNFTTPACLSPTGLVSANTTHNSSDLSWNTQGSNSFEYLVDQTSTSTSPTGSGTSTAGTTYNATGLNPSTTYYLHVRTNCGGGNFSSWSTTSFTTLIEPCLAPTGLTAANTTHNSSDLSWNAQGSSTYEYVVDQIATDPTSGTVTNGTTFNATGLDPLTTYYLHVRTNCVQGNTSGWTTISFTTLIEPCDTPTGLTAANTTHNSSDLSWNVQGSSTYEYVVDQIATDPTSGTATNGTTSNATGLDPLTTYYLHVRTNCVQGNTSGWTTISFTTLIEPCLAPTGLTAANTTHNSSDLSWNAQGSSTYEYVVDQIATDPTSGTATNGTTFNVTGLDPLTTYYLHVRTNCVQGNTSGWTTISFTTLIEPCLAPTGLMAANTTHNSSDLSWNAQGASTYEYVVDQIATDPASGTATNGTTFNATGLDPLTTYYLHVRTNCVQGNTSGWTTISFTTLIEPCVAPTGLTAANTTHNSSDLSWSAQGSSTYEYVVDQIATDPTSGTVTNGTTFNATGLDPLTTYYLHVRANCVQGNTSGWTTISFTTLIEPCLAPTGLTAANTTHNSSDLSWNSQGSSTYEYVVDQIATDPTSGTATNGTTFNTTGLDPLTTYYLHVRTNCVQGNTSGWTTISFTTLIEPCLVPTGLTAANTTHNSSNISWDSQGGNTFEYVIDQIAADPTGLGTPTTGTAYNPTTLNPTTTYYFHLRTDCSGTNFSPWITVSFTTLVEPCIAPTGLTAANTTHNSSDLSWNAQGASTYEYVVDQIATDPTSGTVTNGTTFNATSLTPSTTYYLHVRTNCVQGNTSAWTTISFTTLVEPCDAPTGLTAANTTENSSNLSWDAQGSNSFEYKVDETATDPTSGTAATGTTFNATGLDASTTYYLHVRTDCGNGNFSNWTTISFTTLVEPCVAPSGVSASNVAGHSANLNWIAQTGNTFEYVLNQTNTNPTGAGTAVSNNTFAATALTGSTTYYFHVRTDCGNGNFSDWTTISFTTSSTVGIDEQEALNLTAYPNPTTGSVTVSGQTEGIVTLTNLKGQQLMTIDLQQQTTLDVSNLESGLYFLVYHNGNKTALIKLIKE